MCLRSSQDKNHPANLICELCRLFYTNGWVTGTGGGISIKESNLIYLAPSGVHKERMEPNDLFVMDYESGEYIERPMNYKPSACTPLFMAAYNKRNAGACIHTHSQSAVLVTKLCHGGEFRISHVEQIKAIPGHQYDSELVIPIIDNTNFEEDLETSLTLAIENYPKSVAVLVRNHGIYVWGDTVWKAKVHNEAIDYLLELYVKMSMLGLLN